MTVVYVTAAALILVIAYVARGPRLALWTLFASALLYLGLIALITRSMG